MACFIPPLGEAQQLFTLRRRRLIQRGIKETGRGKASSSRSQRETCGLTLCATEVSPAVSKGHCLPSFVVLGNTCISKQVSAGQHGRVYGFL